MGLKLKSRVTEKKLGASERERPPLFLHFNCES